MTVKELIIKLERVENKELDVVIFSEDYDYITDIDVIETNKYYGKSEPYGWETKTRDCVVLV